MMEKPQEELLWDGEELMETFIINSQPLLETESADLRSSLVINGVTRPPLLLQAKVN